MSRLVAGIVFNGCRAKSACTVAVAAALLVGTAAMAHDDTGKVDYSLWEQHDSLVDHESAPIPQPQRVPSFTFASRPRHFTSRPWDYRVVASRPWRQKPRAVVVVGKAQQAVPATAVSLYEDKTLRRGDAVMTDSGLRIFEGSRTFPYRPSDFSILAASHSVVRSLRKNLALYDHQLPLREEFAEAPALTIRPK